MLLHVHEPHLCKEVSALPLGDNNGVCAFGILEPELDGRHESQTLLGAFRVVVFDELDDRCDHILLGHLVVLHVAFPESAVEAFGLDYAVKRFHRIHEYSCMRCYTQHNYTRMFFLMLTKR